MIELTRGDTGRFKFRRKAKNGDVVRKKADEVTFTVKESYYSKNPVIQKKLSAGSITFDETDCYYRFKINEEDTKKLSYKSYVYDIEVRFEDNVKTIKKGDFVIDEEVSF